MTIEELTELLASALKDATVRGPQISGLPPITIDLESYKGQLLNFRHRFDPVQRRFAEGCTIVVQDQSIVASLRMAVEEHLGQYIQDGYIQSAIFAINGGSTGGFTVESFIDHWLEIALARGPAVAARSFWDGVEAHAMQCHRITLVLGVQVEEELKVGDGIRLVPIPGTVADFPYYLPHLLNQRDNGHFASGTLLVVDTVVSPVFVNPSETLTQRDRSKIFDYRDVAGNYYDFNNEEFCNALGLVSGRAVYGVAWWSFIDDDHICKVPSRGGYHYNPDAVDLRSIGIQHSIITTPLAREALDLYRIRRNLPQATRERLTVPIDRWMRSFTDPRLSDKWIDLGIALESTFLAENNKDDVSYRLRLNAARFLGATMDERKQPMRDFRSIYEFRSRAVHRGAVDFRQNMIETLEKAQKYCQEGIIKIIKDGGFPNWDELVLE